MDNLSQPELPNLVSILENKLKATPLASFLAAWEDIIFSTAIICILSLFAFFVSRKRKLIPGRMQSCVEIFVEYFGEFVCGVLGPKGMKYVPFIGTIFIYVLFMNLLGLVPLMKSATTNWSVTLALAVCVFIYVQYAGFKKLGFIGYIDVMMERPRGMLLYSVIFPVIMFFINLVSKLLQPVTLSLRLRSNVWGDDMLLAVLAGFGIKGVPLLLFSTVLTIISSVVQAVVFSLLTTIYFALVLVDEE